MCGANGERIFKNTSYSFFNTNSLLSISFSNIIMAEIAVLKAILSISSLTFFIVRLWLQHRYHTETYSRNASIEGAMWYAPSRRCTNPPASSILMSFDIWKLVRVGWRKFLALHMQGSTTRSRPSWAWCLFLFWPCPRILDTWY